MDALTRKPLGYVKNRSAILSSGDVELRRLALDIAEAAIAHADPGLALHRYLTLDGDVLRVGDTRVELGPGRRVFVIGAGKASLPVAQALEDILGDRIHRGLVICKSGQDGSLARIEMRFASHPIPNEASLEGAARTRDLLKEVRSGDVVLACFTGGSSALFVSPVPGISLADKAITNQILLTCGANILEINAVRKHLSTVKGGRLARDLPAGVHLINLTVSDVIGDPLDYITDPTVPDTSSFADAIATLDKYELFPKLPETVASYLRSSPEADRTVRPDELAHLHRTDVILVRTDAACEGAVQAARRLGLTPMLLSTCFEGESSTLAKNLVAIAKQVRLNGNPIAAPCVLIGGGETTVVVNGTCGTGGPNQEFAAGAALELADIRGVVALGLDTDGTDGPTEYAGAVVDGTSYSHALGLGVDLRAALREHNVTPALCRSGNAMITGATGTNVNDLKLILITA